MTQPAPTPLPAEDAPQPWDRAVPGGAFVLDQPDGIPAVWGHDSEVLWPLGEPLYIVGPAGAGKTTVAQQVALARIGIRPADVLGLPVNDDAGRLLYIAGDRPRQAARSMGRMVTDQDRDQLDQRLTVWPGPLTFHLPTEPERLLGMARHYQATTVVIDSLKDVANDLERPETAAAVNSALQHLVANDVEVAVLHHQRKASGDNRKPTSLADVYGGTWLTAGAGSVVLLWGDPGALAVDLTHLKQPAETVGPLTLLHDHDHGTTTVADKPDPLAILRRATKGISARTMAQALTGNTDPNRDAVERARRQLERLHRNGLATKRDGDKATNTPALYLPATLLEDAA